MTDPIEKLTEHSNLVFLSNFVHQIVNPLNGIAGTIDNLYEGGIYAPEVEKQKLNAVRAQLEQCISLIRNLAFFSEISLLQSEDDENRGLKKPNFSTKAVLPQCIIESMQFFQILGEERRINLSLLDRKNQYVIYARPELIKQIFINLFDNWIKYGLQNQHIDIIPRVNHEQELLVEISGKSIGFDFSLSEKIFDIGIRAEQAKSTLAQGTGIGLYICKMIMLSIGGRITATHSPKTQITSFFIYFPKNSWGFNESK